MFQKLNNYTGKRLDGYKVEVLDENGSSNSALTISLGIGENPGSDGTPGDIWDNESKANFSHGLWGPVDHHFEEPGFFDDRRVFYTPTLSSGDQVISYQGPVLGGNYQALFGDWLPAGWEPSGIFHDDDMNPATDGTLKAFWGDPLNTGTNAWHMGNSSNWETATEEDLLRWTGEWYEQSDIEDVLNLGLNYIINVGDNTSIGSKFTVRFTPHVASNQSQPAFVSNPPPALNYTDSAGIIVMDVQMVPDEEAVSTVPGDDPTVDAYDAPLVALRSVVEQPENVIDQSAVITVGVADGDLNTDPGIAEKVEITVTSDQGEMELVTLTESGADTGKFIGTLAAEVANADMQDNDGKFNLNMRTNLKASYVDNKYGDQAEPQILEASLDVDVETATDVDDDTPVIIDDEPVVVDDEPVSSGSSDSTFDAQSDASFMLMLLGFLGMGGFIARRKLGTKEK